MIASQRNAIAAPVAGLIVYCTDCGTNGGEPEFYNGTAWVNMISGTAAAPLAIGHIYLGGKIAYIFQPWDPGYIAGEVHGLIAAASDQSTVIQWENGANSSPQDQQPIPRPSAMQNVSFDYCQKLL